MKTYENGRPGPNEFRDVCNRTGSIRTGIGLSMYIDPPMLSITMIAKIGSLLLHFKQQGFETLEHWISCSWLRRTIGLQVQHI